MFLNYMSDVEAGDVETLASEGHSCILVEPPAAWGGWLRNKTCCLPRACGLQVGLQEVVPWTRTGILEAVWIDRSWLTSFSALRLPGPTVRVVFRFNVTDSCLCSSPIRRVSGGVNVLHGVESGLGKAVDDLGPSLSGQPVLSPCDRVGLEQSQVACT